MYDGAVCPTEHFATSLHSSTHKRTKYHGSNVGSGRRYAHADVSSKKGSKKIRSWCCSRGCYSQIAARQWLKSLIESIKATASLGFGDQEPDMIC